MDYKCGICGESNLKLWREVYSEIKLMCVDCAHKYQEEDIAEFDVKKCDQIGWMVPAVPTPEGDNFWGYTSVPQDGVDWWHSLPLRKETAVEVL